MEPVVRGATLLNGCALLDWAGEKANSHLKMLTSQTMERVKEIQSFSHYL